MSQTLELPDPVYSALEAAARANGITPTAWIADRLAANNAGASKVADGTPKPRNLAELLVDYIGKIHSGRKELSENTGKKFIDYLDSR